MHLASHITLFIHLLIHIINICIHLFIHTITHTNIQIIRITKPLIKPHITTHTCKHTYIQPHRNIHKHNIQTYKYNILTYTQQCIDTWYHKFVQLCSFNNITSFCWVIIGFYFSTQISASIFFHLRYYCSHDTSKQMLSII